MGRVARRRRIAASPEKVWELIVDPYNLPRWWPRTARVEGVNVSGNDSGGQWTKVLETESGRTVRADYHRSAQTEGEHYGWEQELEGTPFERHLQRSKVGIDLQPEGDGTKVTIASEQRLRGLSRLGSPMMRRGQGAILEEALDGIERALEPRA